MWESPERGKLQTQMGRPMQPQQIANACGGSKSDIEKWIKELEVNGVLSRSEDGCIWCRRMVRDEENRKRLVEIGKTGGNPKLGVEYNIPGFLYFAQRSRDGAVKIGISANPSKRIYQLRNKELSGSVELIGQKWVEDMGSEEKRLHERFKSCGSGEWFLLTAPQIAELTSELIPLDIQLKRNTGPSSSSSASSSPSKKESVFAEEAEAGRIAEQMYERHPKKKDLVHVFPILQRIAEKGGIPELKKIDAAHAIKCKDPKWADPQYVPSLAIWLGDKGWTEKGLINEATGKEDMIRIWDKKNNCEKWVRIEDTIPA
jgi:hypothetical protein